MFTLFSKVNDQTENDLETPLENSLAFKAVLNYNALTETFNQHISPLPPEAFNEFNFSLDICIKPKTQKEVLNWR